MERKERNDAVDFFRGTVVDLKLDRWFTVVLREELIIGVRWVSRGNGQTGNECRQAYCPYCYSSVQLKKTGNLVDILCEFVTRATSI